MPDFNPANPGDLVYPKYAVVTTMPLRIGTFIKGRVYGTNADGSVQDNAVSDFTDGMFQALDTPDVQPTVNGADSLQFAGPRTRMMFPTGIAGMRLGDDIYYIPATGLVTNAITAGLKLGKLFEIYNLQADNISQKFLTVDGDKVIVETVEP